MNEHDLSSELTPSEPSADIEKILLEAAQFYLLAEPSEGTIYEIAPPDESQFERDVYNIWLQRLGNGDDTQFKIDFAEIKRRIEAEGPEALIDQQRAKRAEAREAATKTAVQLGSAATGVRGLFSRRRKS